MTCMLTYKGKKWKLTFIAISLQIVWQKFYRNAPWVVLYQTWILSKPLNLRINARNILKIIFSEAISGMKLKLCRNVHNIGLYKSYVFYCCCSCAFVAMTTKSFHWLIMRKVKVGLYCHLIADILTKILQRCSLSSPLPNIWLLSKPLNLIGYHGNQKDKFVKKYLESSPQKLFLKANEAETMQKP